MHHLYRMCLWSFLLVASWAGLAAAGPEWRTLGPAGGRVLTLAVSPVDDAVVWAGTPHGAYRSEDGGLSWRFAGLLGEEILALAVDPTTPDVVYAGVAARRLGTGGVLVTRDGGATWVSGRSGLEDPRDASESPPSRYLPVNALLADPSTPGVVWAGTGGHGGLFRSIDGGATWTWQAFIHDVRGLATHPTLGGRLFAAADYALRRSEDGGATWSLLHDGMPLPVTIDHLAVAPSNPDVLYAASSTLIFTSGDGGDHWHAVADSSTHDLGPSGITALVIDPHDAEHVLVATRLHGVYETDDGGGAWRQAGDGLECSPGDSAVTHLRPTALAVSASSGRLLAGTEREGIFVRSLAGGRWTPSTDGPSAVSATGIALDPDDPGTLLVTTAGRGIQRSTDGGATWADANAGIPGDCGPWNYLPTAFPVPFCHAMADLLWSRSGDRVLAASECGLFASSDRGRSWTEVPAPDWIDVLAPSPSDDDIVYLIGGTGDRRGVSRSADGGFTWTACAAAPDGVRPSSLAVSPADSDIVLLGTHAGLYVSRDGCSTWVGPASVSGAPCGDWRDDTIRALGWMPAGSGRALAGTDCGLLLSDDGGETWVDAGLPGAVVTAFAFAGASVVAGTWGNGVWESRDQGTTWWPVDDGTLKPFVHSLTFDLHSRRLLAATEGGGVLTLRLPPAPRRPEVRRGPTRAEDSPLALHRELP